MTPPPSTLSLVAQRLQDVSLPGEERAAGGSSVAIARHAEGMTSELELRSELQALGFKGLRAENLVLQAILRRGLELYRERRSLWQAEVRAGRLATAEYATLLEESGVEQEVIALDLQVLASQRPAQVRRLVSLGLVAHVSTPLPTARPRARALTLALTAVAGEVPGTAPRLRSVALSLAVAETEFVETPAQRRAVTLILAAHPAQEV